MISFKMVDGSRYDTDEPVIESDGWTVIEVGGKVVMLNPAHVVSVTVKGESS